MLQFLTFIRVCMEMFQHVTVFDFYKSLHGNVSTCYRGGGHFRRNTKFFEAPTKEAPTKEKISPPCNVSENADNGYFLS